MQQISCTKEQTEKLQNLELRLKHAEDALVNDFRIYVEVTNKIKELIGAQALSLAEFSTYSECIENRVDLVFDSDYKTLMVRKATEDVLAYAADMVVTLTPEQITHYRHQLRAWNHENNAAENGLLALTNYIGTMHDRQQAEVLRLCPDTPKDILEIHIDAVEGKLYIKYV